MASRSTDRQRKQELIQSLAQSRETLHTSRRELRQQLNPAHRLRSAVHKYPLQIFGLAAGGALAVSLLVRRPRSREEPVSTRRRLLRWALSLAKPAAGNWLLNRAKEHFLTLPAPPSAHTQ